jgi:hypothetical protein
MPDDEVVKLPVSVVLNSPRLVVKSGEVVVPKLEDGFWELSVSDRLVWTDGEKLVIEMAVPVAGMLKELYATAVLELFTSSRDDDELFDVCSLVLSPLRLDVAMMELTDVVSRNVKLGAPVTSVGLATEVGYRDSELDSRDEILEIMVVSEMVEESSNVVATLRSLVSTNGADDEELLPEVITLEVSVRSPADIDVLPIRVFELPSNGLEVGIEAVDCSSDVVDIMLVSIVMDRVDVPETLAVYSLSEELKPELSVTEPDENTDRLGMVTELVRPSIVEVSSEANEVEGVVLISPKVPVSKVSVEDDISIVFWVLLVLVSDIIVVEAMLVMLSSMVELVAVSSNEVGFDVLKLSFGLVPLSTPLEIEVEVSMVAASEDETWSAVSMLVVVVETSRLPLSEFVTESSGEVWLKYAEADLVR